MLHVSKTKIAQIEAINNNLIPEWKEELKKERLTFSAAYELSGMTEDEQHETLGKFSETGELTHKEVKDMKEAKTAGQQVSESDTAENGMNPPEARAGDDYETPHPEGITSLCYSCTEYETCNVKTGTCTSCDQYKNRAEAYKTDEQRYSEEQDAIDRETKKKLREMEQEEKMQKLPSTAPEEIKTIRVSQDKFEEYTGEYRKPYMITKDDGFKVGNVVKLVVFVAGKATGEYIEITQQIRTTPLMEDVPVYGTKTNPDTGEKERVQVGTRQVVNGERERLMIIQDRCMKQCRQGASDFGLTVSSRCRLVVPKPQQQKPENKFAKYAN